MVAGTGAGAGTGFGSLMGVGRGSLVTRRTTLPISIFDLLLCYAACGVFSAAVLAITGLANIVGIFSQAGTSEAYSDARRKVLDDPAGMSASLIFRCTISVRRDRDQGSTELAQLAIACRGRK